MRRIFFSLLVVLSLLSASCSSAIPSFKPYKMDIQQGNVVTSKMMLQLRPGMSKSQARFIMGTPLIQDPFHSNRWDYFYEMRKGGKVVEQRHVTLDFEKEALVRVRGDVVPAGEGDDTAKPTTGTEPVSQPEAEKKGLMDKLQFWNKDKKAPTTPEAAPANLVSPGAQKPVAQEPVPAKEVPSVIAVPPVVAPEPSMPVAEPAKSQPAPAPVAEPVKPEPAPALEPAPAIKSKPEAKPMPAPEPEPAPAVEPVKPEPVKVEEPAPVAKPAPEPIAEPVVKPVEKTTEKPMEKATEVPAEEPAAKPEVKARPQAETKPTPTPGKEPEEDEPGYFEYMLQKIGF